MLVTRTTGETRAAVSQARARGCVIGFVPTMGALHAGHRSLVGEARRQSDFVAVSVFVNPTQFGPQEDFQEYPRTWEADRAACEQDGVDLVFAPEVAEMYPSPGLTTVRVSGLTDRLCGAFRPGHFDGVTTVVAKLFGIVAPDRAFFGEKDFQQAVVIRRMTRDLNMPVEVVLCPTVREPDGLAMSSRNQYLTPEQRRQAPVLHAALCAAAGQVRAGRTDAAELIRGVEHRIRASGPVEIDYVRIVDPLTLKDVERVECRARLCLAVRLGSCRLIDNLAIDPGAG